MLPADLGREGAGEHVVLEGLELQDAGLVVSIGALEGAAEPVGLEGVERQDEPEYP